MYMFRIGVCKGVGGCKMGVCSCGDVGELMQLGTQKYSRMLSTHASDVVSSKA